MKTSLSQVIKRSIDYLTRKHSWIELVARNPWLANILFFFYVAAVVGMIYQTHGGIEDGWKEVVKTYSPIFFDLLLIFLISIIIIIIRGYIGEERTRIDIDREPDPKFFIQLPPAAIHIEVQNDAFFQRHPAVAAILDALPVDQHDFFLTHAGPLDIPKVTLKSIEVDCNSEIKLTLGIASFKEFFFTHHFPDYILARSSSGDQGRKETLRNLFSPIYENSYADFFSQKSQKLELLGYTPNTIGVTGCVMLSNEVDTIFFLQIRGVHESAARGKLQLSYAGTISCYPNFSKHSKAFSIDDLAHEEFEDEFIKGSVGKILTEQKLIESVTHKLVGMCTNSQYLYQPELFFLTEIKISKGTLLPHLRKKLDKISGSNFIAIKSLNEVEKLIALEKYQIRPLCRVTIEKIFNPHISDTKKTIKKDQKYN